MNRGKTSLLAASCLLLTSMVAHAGGSSSTTATHHVHHHARAHARHASLSLDGPALHSSAALVFDETNRSVLYSRNADVAMPIASISKLVTALTVADAKQPMDEIIEITNEDRAVGKGAASRLAVGTRLTRGDLFHLALMASENRAAHALARNYPGGMAAFMPAMNAKARQLGMTSSHFVEPTGLSYENVASPEDLSKLVAAASHNATIREYSTDPSYDVRIGRRMVGFHNTNSLVNNPSWDIIVQKTGFINEAGRCLVMQTKIQDRTVDIVLLNSYGKKTRVADATRIRKWMEAKLLRGTAAGEANKT
ncbi:MAG TPA: D-alanyl-D-alanine endopeptidase [Steroidobacteraceae bacterium]|nr:D-alanyl-D-alanine endopeptidase [Steroidobacteraceae bacterium]